MDDLVLVLGSIGAIALVYLLDALLEDGD